MSSCTNRFCLLAALAASLSATADPDVQALVDRQVARGQDVVTIPAGRYRVAPHGGRHLILSGLTNATVDATGVEIVCTAYANALVVTNCSGLTVRGLAIDYDPLPWTQGRVTAVDAKTRTAEVDAMNPTGRTLPSAIQFSLSRGWNSGRRFHAVVLV